MANTAQYLADEVNRQLQYLPKYTLELRLAALTRAQNALAVWARWNSDVWSTTNGYTGTGTLAQEIALPDNVLAVHAVTFDGFPLKPMSEEEWLNTRGEQSVVTGTPGQYYIRNNAFIELYPRPSYQATMQVYITPLPPVLSASDLTAVGAFPEHCSPTLISYACWDLIQSEPEELERSDRFFKSYMAQRTEASFGLKVNTKTKVKRRGKL